MVATSSARWYASWAGVGSGSVVVAPAGVGSGSVVVAPAGVGSGSVLPSGPTRKMAAIIIWLCGFSPCGLHRRPNDSQG